MMISLTTEQQATLLFRADTQPRRRVKRWLKDQGGEGVAAELDEALAKAKTNEEAVKGAAELIRLATAADRQEAEECEREEVARKAAADEINVATLRRAQWVASRIAADKQARIKA